MDTRDFARQYLGKCEYKGDEITPTYCPYCGGGKNKDKHTFSLNTVKETFSCLRGTCGKRGHFSELCKHFGVEADKSDNYEMYKKDVKHYATPTTPTKPITTAVEEYCKLRGISKETLDFYGVKSDGKGNIMFPYSENGKHVLTKFRPAGKFVKGEGKQKSWRDKGGKPILWGMDLCTNEYPLVITEGEMDTLVCYEAGVKNVVSVPSGSEDLTWVDTCWDWLKRFKKIILFGDNDKAGIEMVKKLTLKLSDYDLYIVNCEYKDANVLLFKEGVEAVKRAVDNAKRVPHRGLINLKDVKKIDIKDNDNIKSGVPALDKSIHGFASGELSVWTGKRGEGKSIFLNQIILEAVDQKIKCAVYSGEMTDAKFKQLVNLQAAGKNNVEKYYDEVFDCEEYEPKAHIEEAITEWYDEKLYLYDNRISSTGNEEDDIMKVFEYAVKRYDCRVLLIDNLMIAADSFGSDRDYYRSQSKFVGKLKEFAIKYNVHIHLVAHPKKTEGNLDNDSISGTGDITNRADNVFSVIRVADEDKEKMNCDSVMKVLKNRSKGVRDQSIAFNYCSISKRLSVKGVGDIKQYGWSRAVPEYKNMIIDENCPF